MLFFLSTSRHIFLDLWVDLNKVILTLVLSLTSLSFAVAEEENLYSSSKNSPVKYHNNGHFFDYQAQPPYNYQNPQHVINLQEIKSSIYSDQETLNNKTNENSIKIRIPPMKTAAGKLAVTWINQTSVLIQLDGVNIVTNPMWQNNQHKNLSLVQDALLSSMGKKSSSQTLGGIEFSKLPPIDIVLLTHTHPKDIHLPTLKHLYQKFKPVFITGLGASPLFQREGITKVIELGWGKKYRFDNTIDIHFLKAYSEQQRLSKRKQLWGSFAVIGKQHRLYFSRHYGDHLNLKHIGQMFGAFDIALLPIINNFTKNKNTMKPEYFVKAGIDLNAKLSAGMLVNHPTHFQAFSFEAMNLIMRKKYKRKALVFKSLNYGDSVYIKPRR